MASGRTPSRGPDIGRAYLGNDRGQNERYAEVRHKVLLRVGQQSWFPGAVVQAAITENV